MMTEKLFEMCLMTGNETREPVFVSFAGHFQVSST